MTSESVDLCALCPCRRMATLSKKAPVPRIDPVLWGQVGRLAARELRSVIAEVECLHREASARRSAWPEPPAARARDGPAGSR